MSRQKQIKGQKKESRSEAISSSANCATNEQAKSNLDNAKIDVNQAAIEAVSKYDELVKAVEVNVIEEALRMGGMALMPNKEGPFTCFVPSEKAFVDYPAGKSEGTRIGPENMLEILKYHTVKGNLTLSDLQRMNKVRTLSGEDLIIDRTSGGRVNGSRIIQHDIEAENGTIHIIDSILIPAHMQNAF